MAETLQLTVTGMTCGGCENAVKRTLTQLRGVRDVRASHAANSVNVTFEEADITPAAIRTAIEGLGYQVAP
jgi:copper chaperone CopZ